MKAFVDTDHSTLSPPAAERPHAIRFCSRCGAPPVEPTMRPNRITPERVCRACGMGLLLTCSSDAVPAPAAAFLIVTFELRVSAVSEAGEKLFGAEREVLGAPLLDVVTSPVGDDVLVGSVSGAAQYARHPVVLPVRLVPGDASTSGTRSARIATCGPPRAALLAIEPSESDRR